METGERPVDHDRFRAETREFDAFLEGFCRGAGASPDCAYVLGDFYEERTHILIVSAIGFPLKPFCLAVQSWLNVQRRRNWRVLINDESFTKRMWLVYDTLILTGDKTKGAIVDAASLT